MAIMCSWDSELYFLFLAQKLCVRVCVPFLSVESVSYILTGSGVFGLMLYQFNLSSIRNSLNTVATEVVLYLK